MGTVQWMTEHADDLLAIVGAGYVLARLIVALTPTEADDRALDKAHIALQAIALTFGLDIKQGRKK